MSAEFVLIYNKDRDPIFVDVSNGDAMWILPSSDCLSNLLYTTHLTETGQPYYEDLRDGGVTWTLPALSKAATNAIKFVQENTRATIEQLIGSHFSLEASIAQVRDVDEYFAYQDELKQNSVKDHSNPESDDETQRDSNFTEEIRPSKAVIIRTVQNIKNMKVKEGYLNKLAIQSGRNWKRRFFILTPLNLAYYVSEEPGQNPKGELQILADSIVTEENVVSKQGFGFKLNNGEESIVLAALTESDRSQWIQTLRSVIALADNIMRVTVTVLSDSTVLMNNRSAFSLGAKATKKYIVFMEGVISVHPDKQTTTTIDGVLNVNAQTKLKVVNEKDLILTLIDSAFQSSTLSIRFDCDPNHDPATFLLWKRAIDQAMADKDDEDYNSSTSNRLRPSSECSVASNSTTGSARELIAAPALGSNYAKGDHSNAIVTANNNSNKAAAVLQSVSVFGLGFDDDNEDDDDEEDVRSSVSSALSTAAASSTGGVQNPQRMTPSAVPCPSSLPAAAEQTAAVAVNSLRQAQQQQQKPPPPPPKSNVRDIVTNPLVRNPPANHHHNHNNIAIAQDPPNQLGFLGNVENDEDEEEGDESAATVAFVEQNATKPSATNRTGGDKVQPLPLASSQPSPVPPPPSLSPSSTVLKMALPNPSSVPVQQPLHVHVPPPPSSSHPHHPPSAHSQTSLISPLHKTTLKVPLKDLVGEDEVKIIAQQVLHPHIGDSDSISESLPQTQQLITHPVQDFLTETHTILNSVTQQLDLVSRQISLVPILSPPQGEAAAESLVKLRLLVREPVNTITTTSSSSTSSDKSIYSAFQQLEQEKQLILQLLEHIRHSEEQAMKKIHLQEVDALKRIRKEAETVQHQFDLAQQELRQANMKHESELERRLALLEKAKKFLDSEQRRLDGEFRHKMRDIAVIARDLAQQHARLQSDRKKMLKSRYQLDLAMQDVFRGLNSLTSSNQDQQQHKQYHNIHKPGDKMKFPSSAANINTQAMVSRKQYVPVLNCSSSSPGRSHRPQTHDPLPQRLNPSLSPANSLHSEGGSIGDSHGVMRQPTPVTQQTVTTRSMSPSPANNLYTNYSNKQQLPNYSSHSNSRATTPPSINNPSQPTNFVKSERILISQGMSKPQTHSGPLRQQQQQQHHQPPQQQQEYFGQNAFPLPANDHYAVQAANQLGHRQPRQSQLFPTQQQQPQSHQKAAPPILTGANSIISRLRSQQQQLTSQLAVPAADQHSLQHHANSGAHKRAPSGYLQSQIQPQQPSSSQLMDKQRR